MELTISWIEQGRQEGFQEGRQEGLQEGRQEVLEQMANLVIHQIERETGSLDPGIQERIRSLSTYQVRQPGEAIEDLNSTEELSAWLDNNSRTVPNFKS